MPCYHPKVAYRKRSGRNPVTGLWPITFDLKDGNPDQEITIPCGVCIGCQLDRSQAWAIRCVNEASLHEKNTFITLTYREYNYSLVKEDFVLFMKRLRKKYGEGIRFFHCGEYGEKFDRPHHHACLFNHDFPDRTYWQTRNGVKLYKSEELEKIWGHGYCVVGDVTYESAAYVARYVTKKIIGRKADIHYEGRQPEYITMSRRPGIGNQWIEKFHNDVYNGDMVIIKKGLTCKPPRYYDNVMERLNKERIEKIKKERKENINLKEKTYPRLSVKETIKILKSKQLLRSYETSQTV